MSAVPRNNLQAYSSTWAYLKKLTRLWFLFCCSDRKCGVRLPAAAAAGRPAPQEPLKMPLALATAPTESVSLTTPPSPRGQLRWLGRGAAGAGGTGIDWGGVADGSANLVSSVVLRGSKEALRTCKKCPPCVAPAPILPAPALDWLSRLPNRPSIRVVPIICCPPWGLQDRPLGASWQAGSSPAGRLPAGWPILAAGKASGKVSAALSI
eukprot:COSAG01_NODE_883_length_12927_cov_10.710789_13_plen_209_part_00